MFNETNCTSSDLHPPVCGVCVCVGSRETSAVKREAVSLISTQTVVPVSFTYRPRSAFLCLLANAELIN
jgi:hypothetical protein